MSFMFFKCSNLTNLDVSKFNTSKVTDMTFMFAQCGSLTNLDVSGFNTSNVVRMDWMFINCSGLTNLDMTNFNTKKVRLVSGMFKKCSGLTSLDLSSFDTSNIIYMEEGGDGMFEDCSNLKTIYVGEGWNTDNVTQSEKMFLNCTKLVGGAGTVYDASHVDKAYAHIDGGPSNPGYLTDINAKTEEVCDADDMQRFIDNTEGDTAEMTPCDEPTIDEDVEVDDIQIFIDGTDKDPQVVIMFIGGCINIHPNAGFSFKSVSFAGNTANAVSLRASGNSGGINNSGTLNFEGCTFLEGDYTITNSKDIYVKQMLSDCHLINKYGGRIYLATPLTKDLYVTIPTSEDVESDIAIIKGKHEEGLQGLLEGYQFTNSDLTHIHLTVPTGYAWRYDATAGGIVVYSVSGITTITPERIVVDCYDLQGRKMSEHRNKGVMIQRTADGTMRKVFY